MKSKFCFVRSLARLNVGNFIYQVWVGSSLRDLTVLSQVEELCRRNGYYLAQWTALVNSRLDEARARFRKGHCQFADPFRTASLTIRQLLEIINGKTFDTFESSCTMTKAEIWYRYHSDLSYIQAQNQSKVIRHAYPRRRKNLSISL